MPPQIPLSDVRPGDLLFNVFVRKDELTGELHPAGVSGHVTICTFANDALVLMTHQVDGKQLKGTWEDQLRPPAATAGNQVLVMRCHGSRELAAEAALWARSWDKFLLPFGSRRRDNATLFEGDAAGEELVAKHRKLFATRAKYRAIKYAARRLGYLCYPGAEDDGQGLFCSMFVSIAYQVAGLVRAGAVTAAGREDLHLRITDKRMPPSAIARVAASLPNAPSALDVASFTGYSAALREPNPYGLRGVPPAEAAEPAKKGPPGVGYLPSLAFWRFDRHPSIEGFPWAAHVTEGMMVDAKVIMPQGLLASLRADPASWQTLGFVTGAHLDLGSFRERFDEKRARADQLRSEFRAGPRH
ncbi:MAG: hypothetical protein ACXW61_09100 [Gemmatirosa sp.]